MVPISYSVAHEQLHQSLAGYKRLDGQILRWLSVELAAVLWRFLDHHERCLARAAGTPEFPVVTTVPSSDAARDEGHPLRQIVSELVGPTRERYRRLLRRSPVTVPPRRFSAQKYVVTEPLSGEAVLVIDDTWTTGANAQSAGAALRAAGAGPLGAVVIGRHINREWGQNDQRLKALPQFEWERCALCAPATAPVRSGVFVSQTTLP